MQATIDTITYSESESMGQGIDFWQEILFNDEAIGCLETRFYGILEPAKESFQIATNLPEEKFEKYPYSESESEGWFILYFDTIEEFLEAHNDINNLVEVPQKGDENDTQTVFQW